MLNLHTIFVYYNIFHSASWDPPYLMSRTSTRAGEGAPEVPEDPSMKLSLTSRCGLLIALWCLVIPGGAVSASQPSEDRRGKPITVRGTLDVVQEADFAAGLKRADTL